MTERKKYTAEFKQRAVDLVLDSGRPVTQVSVDIGVNEGTLGNWVRKYRQEHPEQFAAEKPESVAYAEHQRVLKENAKLKQEVEFLSKVSLDSNRQGNSRRLLRVHRSREGQLFDRHDVPGLRGLARFVLSVAQTQTTVISTTGTAPTARGRRQAGLYGC